LTGRCCGSPAGPGLVRGVTCRQQEFFESHSHVGRDFPQECRRDVTSFVNGHGRAPTIAVSKLLVGTPLPDFGEAMGNEEGRYPRLSHKDRLYVNELRFEFGVSILQ